jgi:hypothetical protein
MHVCVTLLTLILYLNKINIVTFDMISASNKLRIILYFGVNLTLPLHARGYKTDIARTYIRENSTAQARTAIDGSQDGKEFRGYFPMLHLCTKAEGVMIMRSAAVTHSKKARERKVDGQNSNGRPFLLLQGDPELLDT